MILPFPFIARTVLSQEQVIDAAQGLRGDPLFYFVVVGMSSLIVILAGVIVFLYRQKDKVHKEQREDSKTLVEALTLQTTLMKQFQLTQGERMDRFERVQQEALTEMKQLQKDALRRQ